MDGSQALDVARHYQGVGSLLPEIVLGAGATFLLLFETFAKPSPGGRRAGLIAAGVLALALVASVLVAGERATAFSGMVVVDPFVDFFRVLSCIAGLLGVALALRSDEIDAALRPEYYCLFLALVLGMILMASASDLLMAFIAVELMSLMSYVLAGLRRHDRRASEAALKYVVYGGAASGVMLVGFSLLYGLTGHTQFSLINQVVVEYGREVARSGLADPTKLVHMPIALTTGMVLSFAGFAYKIAAVPLHMWSPDVYEGAPTPFTAFLSTGPKAAGFALLTRFFVVGFSDAAQFDQNLLTDISALPWLILVIVVSMATMTVGNLAAIGQSNIKRFLAYSSIAHAGYALIGLAAFSKTGASSVLLYMAIYVLMNIGTFYAVIWVREQTGSELINDYQGLGHRAPLVGITMTLFFVSLTGLPPLAGFIAKYKLFAAALERAFGFEAASRCAPAVMEHAEILDKLACTFGGSGMFYALGTLAVVNSAISLYYYFRVVKKMFLEKPENPAPIPVDGLTKVVLVGVSALLLWFGIFPTALETQSDKAIEFHRPTLAEVQPSLTPSLAAKQIPAATTAEVTPAPNPAPAPQ